MRAEQLLECWFEHLLGRLGVSATPAQRCDALRSRRDSGSEGHIDLRRIVRADREIVSFCLGSADRDVQRSENA